MKSILMSIQPKWVAKILNGEKTIEVRKRFKLDYRGWAYIYCTKDKVFELCYPTNFNNELNIYDRVVNGKVVARFYCDNVEEIDCTGFYEDLSFGKGRDIESYNTNTLTEEELLDKSCLTEEEMHDYLDCGCQRRAIHISQLEIFDKPKELSEFYTKHYPQFVNMVKNKTHYELTPLTKAPQSYCWIEVLDDVE